MLFNSYLYIFVFLPVSLAGFFFLARRVGDTAALVWLTALSFVFYGWWNPVFVLLLAASIVFNYGCGRFLQAASGEGRALPVLAFAITANLAVLGYYKYAGFFAGIANALFGTAFSVQAIVLPLAISFFTFQQIAYLVDAYKGDAPDEGFLRYCLFVTFFPKLIAGPIVRHREMMPQLQEARIFRFLSANLAVGSAIFIVGLFKKVVLADSLDAYVTPTFAMAEAGQVPSFVQAWLGVFACSLQVYFDFSGYTDMAIGAALMFGIQIPMNFFSPYKATSITELWRRWHMTLTRLIRECVFIPISLRLARISMRLNAGAWPMLLLANVLPLIITFVVIGLWHGASWNFVLYGFLQGLLLSLHAVWQQLQRSTALKRIRIPAALALAMTMLVWFWSIVPSRAASLPAIKLIYGAMLDAPALLQGIDGMHQALGIVLVLYILVLWLPNTEQLFSAYRPRLGDKALERLRVASPFVWQENPAWAAFLACVFFVAVVLMTHDVEFIYFKF
jgi:alginate O-acetyltransferase complex protein AlgI